tara:strand:- start:675 stop:2099 length:1425 start_codon:yes stop_codon:yes gene_type:complete
MLNFAINNYELYPIKVFRKNEDKIPPNEMSIFLDDIYHDEWNENLFSQILDCMEFPVSFVAMENLEKPLRSDVSKILNTFKVKGSKILGGLQCLNNKHFIKSPGIGFSNNIKLQLMLKQIPSFWFNQPIGHIEYCSKTRNKLSRLGFLNKSNEESNFISLANKLIPKNLPKIYVEGFPHLINSIDKLAWPKNPKSITTSNQVYNNDTLKAWIGDKIESKVPFKIIQHGGGYGIGKFFFNEYHEIAISDHFISWGWDSKKETKVKALGAPKKRKFFKKKYKNKSNILIFTTCLPRYSYKLYSEVIAGQWENYFSDLCFFFEALNPKIQKKVRIKPYKKDLGRGLKERLFERNKDIKFFDSKKNIYPLEQFSLIVSTYNSTTFLETLSNNIPSLIYWDPKYWELNSSAGFFFRKLESVGVFHKNPGSASNHLNVIGDNILDWWQGNDVQNIRKEFCQNYSRIEKEYIRKLMKIITL